MVAWQATGSVVRAQEGIAPAAVYRARVTAVLAEGTEESGGYENPYQELTVELLDGPERGVVVPLEHGRTFSITDAQKVSVGDTVVVEFLEQQSAGRYVITDKYRLEPLVWISVGFFLLVILSAGLKGLGSIIGMVLSLAVIVVYVVPQILAGRDPLVVSLTGSAFILLSTMYLAHGYSRQTTIAVMATAATLLITGVLSTLFVNLAHLTGMGSEDAYSLKLGATAAINLKGLLLGGMILGALGVLDDITTSQVAAVFELKRANRSLGLADLVKRARAIGVEHIASLVNTLVMAYAGAAMPLFIIIVLNPTNLPLWAIFNSEFLAEEIVRTLSGSIGLVLAVPVTTGAAAWYLTRWPTEV